MSFFDCNYVLKASEGDVHQSHSTVEGLNNKLTCLDCPVQGLVGPKKSILVHEWGQGVKVRHLDQGSALVFKLLQVTAGRVQQYSHFFG